MTRKLVFTLTLMVLMAAMFVSVPAARADSLTITFSPANITANPGQTVSYYATLAAPTSNSGAVSLLQDAFTLAGAFNLAPGGDIDDSGFFFGAPLSMNPGDSFTGLMFTLSVPASFAPDGSTYAGTFTINDGTNDLGTGAFSVTVPEPATMTLLGGSLLGLAGLIRRKK